MNAQDIMRRLAPDGRATRTSGGWLVRCPAHEDRGPSLSVGEGADGRVLLRCFAGCTPEAVCAALGLKVADLFVETRPGPDRWRPLPPKPADSPEKAAKRQGWPAFAVPTAAELRTLSHLRNLSREWLALPVDRGILWSCDYQGARCWVVTDSSRRVAQVRRYDGQPLRNQDGEAKALTLPGSMVSWPLGLPEAALFDGIMLCEGGPDLLAAFCFIVMEGREADTAAVTMLGASLAIHPDALPDFAGNAIRVMAQSDEAGETACVRWSAQLRPFAKHVDSVSFYGLRQADGSPVKDLNDVTNIHADDFEEHRWLWALCPTKEVAK